MSPLNPTVRSRAQVIVREALHRGEPPTDVYPIAVGRRRIYASAESNTIVACDAVTAGGTTFYLGLRR